MLFGVLLLLSVASEAQINNNQAHASLQVRVGRNANIQCSFPLYFGWLVKGQTRTILASDPLQYGSSPSMTLGGPAQFLATGEPTSTLTVSFPTTCVLDLYVNYVLVPGNSITFNRGTVLYTRSGNGSPTAQSFATPFVTGPNVSNSFTFLGSPGGATPTTAFWVGGTVTPPTNVLDGYYEGTYTVTISGYQM